MSKLSPACHANVVVGEATTIGCRMTVVVQGPNKLRATPPQSQPTIQTHAFQNSVATLEKKGGVHWCNCLPDGGVEMIARQRGR